MFMTSISLLIAPVAPEPQKMTQSSSPPPTARMDDLARVVAELRRLAAGAARLGVRVRVERHHLFADELLDERDRAARRGVVGVGDAARTVGTFERVVVTDDRGANRFDQPSALGMHPVQISRFARGCWRYPLRRI